LRSVIASLENEQKRMNLDAGQQFTIISRMECCGMGRSFLILELCRLWCQFVLAFVCYRASVAA
jgi:hypothetical protein